MATNDVKHAHNEFNYYFWGRWGCVGLFPQCVPIKFLSLSTSSLSSQFVRQNVSIITSLCPICFAQCCALGSFLKWANIGTYMFSCLKWMSLCYRVSKFSKTFMMDYSKKFIAIYIYTHTLQVFVGCFITLLQASSCNVDWRSTSPNLNISWVKSNPCKEILFFSHFFNDLHRIFL